MQVAISDKGTAIVGGVPVDLPDVAKEMLQEQYPGKYGTSPFLVDDATAQRITDLPEVQELLAPEPTNVVSKKQLVRAAEAAGQLEALAPAIQDNSVAAIKWAAFDRMSRDDLVPFEELVGGSEALDMLFAAAQAMPG